MIRRTVLITAAALVTFGAVAPALAEKATPKAPASGHSLCVGMSDGNPNTMDGICIEIPTH
jgi:hypothetical protein